MRLFLGAGLLALVACGGVAGPCYVTKAVTLTNPYEGFRFNLSVPEPDTAYTVRVAVEHSTGNPIPDSCEVACVYQDPAFFVVYLKSPPGEGATVTYEVDVRGLRNSCTLEQM